MVKRLIVKLKTQYLQLIPTYTTPNAAKIVDTIIDMPCGNTSLVPNDVKEGHFVVLSVNPEEEPQRFVVELQWLTHPSFLKLLQEAEDEYEFRQEGGLEFPCRVEKLEKVLATCAIAV